MKSVVEMFKQAADAVDETHCTADASEKLRASVGLVELMMRGVAEGFNQKRWEDGQRVMVATDMKGR